MNRQSRIAREIATKVQALCGRSYSKYPKDYPDYKETTVIAFIYVCP
jgi:hypothetical protein